MGLFILPGRLKAELRELAGYLSGAKALQEPAETDAAYKHWTWLMEIVARRGLCASFEEAEQVLRDEVAAICAQVLADAGVYKQDAHGLAGMKRFLSTVGYQETV